MQSGKAPNSKDESVRYLTAFLLLATVALSSACGQAAGSQPTTDSPGPNLLTMKQVRAALAGSGATDIQTQNVQGLPWPQLVGYYVRGDNCDCTYAAVGITVTSSERYASQMLEGAQEQARKRKPGQWWQVERAFQHKNLLIVYMGDKNHLDAATTTVRGI
jgi:hypothetical protein